MPILKPEEPASRLSHTPSNLPVSFFERGAWFLRLQQNVGSLQQTMNETPHRSVTRSRWNTWRQMEGLFLPALDLDFM